MNSSAKGDADRHCLAARFVDGPHVSAPDKAEQRLADWLADLAPEQAAAIGDLIGPISSAPKPFCWASRKPRPIFSILCAPMARARSGCSNASRNGIWPN